MSPKEYGTDGLRRSRAGVAIFTGSFGDKTM